MQTRNKRSVLETTLPVFALGLAGSFSVQRHQVARTQDGMVRCDLTFIMTDVSNSDRGQYAPLFDAMLEEMASGASDIPGELQVCTGLRHERDAWFLEQRVFDPTLTFPELGKGIKSGTFHPSSRIQG